MSTQPQGPPGYNEYTKSQEAQGVTAAHQQPAVQFVPVTTTAYPMPNLQPVPQVQVVNQQQPQYKGPSDFLILALITMIACGILNITSMFFGVPAVVFAAMSMHNRTSVRNYAVARKYSNIAIGLIVFCIVYTLVWAVVLAGVVTAYSTRRNYYYYG